MFSGRGINAQVQDVRMWSGMTGIFSRDATLQVDRLSMFGLEAAGVRLDGGTLRARDCRIEGSWIGFEGQSDSKVDVENCEIIGGFRGALWRDKTSGTFSSNVVRKMRNYAVAGEEGANVAMAVLNKSDVEQDMESWSDEYVEWYCRDWRFSYYDPFNTFGKKPAEESAKSALAATTLAEKALAALRSDKPPIEADYPKHRFRREKRMSMEERRKAREEQTIEMAALLASMGAGQKK